MNLHRITNLATFEEFLAGWLLNTGCTNISGGPPIKRTFPLLSEASLIRPTMGMTFTFESIKTSRLISCHQVRPGHDTLKVLLNPFDLLGWILFMTSFTVISALLCLISVKDHVSSIIFTGRVCIEIPTVIEGSRLKKRYSTSFTMVILIWLLIAGTVLTNWYKTAFTMDMILPTRYSAPWNSISDVADFNFILPVFEGPLSAFANNRTTKTWYVTTFYQPLETKLTILSSYYGDSIRLNAYKKLALALMQSIPTIRYPDMDKSVIRVTPVLYEDLDTFVGNMSKCVKLGYLDSDENIDTILPFMNDNKNRVVFLKTEDGFFPKTWSWFGVKVRENYVLNKLIVMQSSGIYKHWVDWFKLVRPKRLFHHFKGWKSPRVERVAKLDF
ncbi:hypothetical protein Fcan01_15980 [Folsomia candida]|uniref:Uncharacterized protein n=1 Tax=Folsomia candida TaxID=158441 RepID=A0A226DVX9_FOLCA|nr:hypothetical protein Fcan01_15980 [Folsomia candida]